MGDSGHRSDHDVSEKHHDYTDWRSEVMNRYKGIASALALALALAGCSSLGLTTTSPAQGVFAARGIFSAALDVANRYKALPACGGMVVVCSTPSVVATLQKSANAANAVLDSA